MSRKMAEVAAQAMAVADTVRSEHTDLSSTVDSSMRELQEQNDHLEAKIDALAVTVKLADAAYRSKSTAASSDGSNTDPAGVGQDGASGMTAADQGVVAELAGKVTLLERAQAGHEVTLANCEAAIQLAASKESVSELSDQIAAQSQAQTDAFTKLKADIAQVSNAKLTTLSVRLSTCSFVC